ncbi:MAG: S8 family serine peptidase [Candidatus Caldarchaeum sp.]|nr:S8 family serine peptidase [Candidatus Caldarchaeum sp.]
MSTGLVKGLGHGFEKALALVKFLEVAEEFSGSGLRVAFIDSGCSKDFPLKDCINLTETSKIDTEGHGAYVHAVLASMLPDAEFILVKVPDPLSDNQLITALNEAVKQSPHVINLSITSETPSDASDPASVYVNHVSKKSLVAVAAGNGGPKMMSIGPPAVAENALTVGAVDLRGRLWKRSSRGPTLDGRWKPDVVAPTGYKPPTDAKTEVWGTSFAAPIAAAIAAPFVKKIGETSAVARILQIAASPVNISQPTTPALTGLRKASLIRKLSTTWPRIFDPRNLAGMGLVDASKTLQIFKTLTKPFSPL